MKRQLALTVAMLTFINISSATVSAEDSDLGTVAASLGAETDYLDILNYYHDEEHPLYSENLDQYSAQCSNVEGYTDFIDFQSAISSGMCYGISAIEVLTHNGVIKPSDIREGSENLCDIRYDKESDYYITAFSAAQGHFEQDKYFKYLKSAFTYQQQAQTVINTAEKCMAENRYFLLMYDDLQSFHHAVAGIGIMNGEWEFDGKKYDKCVLTLDCNIISKDTGSLSPFHEKSCLYIDSETLEYYIPAYDLSSGEGGVYLVAVYDDTLLSYKGPFPYDSKLSQTVTEMNFLRYRNNNYIDYSGTVTEYNGEKHEIQDQINEIRMVSYYDHYLTGKTFDIESRKRNERYDPQIVLQNVRSQISASSKYDVRYYFDEDLFRLSPLNENEKVNYDIQIMYNDGYYTTMPHFNWRLLGETPSFITLSMKEEGLLLSSESDIKCRIMLKDNKYGETEPASNDFKLTSIENILLKFDNNGLGFYIDPDGDNNYDNKVEKGDVNCDGIIDARDATAVLTDYALNSANKGYLSFVNAYLADYDENDIVDGRDATAILTTYAKSSVNS